MYKIFFNTQPVNFFYLLRYYCNAHDHIVTFFLVFLRKIYISFTSFLLYSFFIILIKFTWQIFRHFYIYEKNYKKENNKKILKKMKYLKMLLLNFYFGIIYIIHKMLVMIKNNLNYLKDSIFECFLREYNRLPFFLLLLLFL